MNTIVLQAKGLIASKRFWICVGVVAAGSAGLLPHEWIDKLTIISVLATKVIDTWQSGG